MFVLTKKSNKSLARTGVLYTAHGKIRTPVFMPIATVGAVKTLTNKELGQLKAQIILGNTYHLYLRPGMQVMGQSKGLHRLMNWSGPILTDSGGYQVFSLAGTKNRKGSLVKIIPEGVVFSSHLDGSKHLFTPEKVLEIQHLIGSDIMMVLDVCSKHPVSYKQAKHDLDLTLTWAQRSKKELTKAKYKKHLAFAIVQGSVFKDLRQLSACRLIEMDFAGYALGGLAVGESNKEMYRVLDWSVPLLPENRPRYLMGVGRPENIVAAVKRGVDMFDCVIPTREARHGRLYSFRHRNLGGRFYSTYSILRQKFRSDFSPINKHSIFPELREYSKAYLHHLFRTAEPLGLRLATLNNLEFYLGLMAEIRKQIRVGII